MGWCGSGSATTELHQTGAQTFNAFHQPPQSYSLHRDQLLVDGAVFVLANDPARASPSPINEPTTLFLH